MTEEEIIKLCEKSKLTEKQWKVLTYESGPYSITTPTLELKSLVENIYSSYIEKIKNDKIEWRCKRCSARVVDGRCKCKESPSPWEPI